MLHLKEKKNRKKSTTYKYSIDPSL